MPPPRPALGRRSRRSGPGWRLAPGRRAPLRARLATRAGPTGAPWTTYA